MSIFCHLASLCGWQILSSSSDFPSISLDQYPSSSHYTRNWDKVVGEINEDDKNEKMEGDAALNKLFQQIYSDGSDEVKRAMNKSFVSTFLWKVENKINICTCPVLLITCVCTPRREVKLDFRPLSFMQQIYSNTLILITTNIMVIKQLQHSDTLCVII